MSGVRFVSIICAMVASFLWGNLVLDAWQKNQSNRAMAQLEAASSSEQDGAGDAAADRGLTVQQRADELAAAASAEFSKLTQGSGDAPGIGLIAASDDAQQLTVPDEADAAIPTPILKANAEALIEKVKTSALVKDKAAVAKAEAAVREAVETSMQVAALESADKVLAEKTAAEMTAKTLVKTVEEVAKPERWSVPVGATPVYDEAKAIRVGELPWQVPTAADPYYPPAVKRKLGKIAAGVSGKAVDATKNVGAKLSSLASDVKKTIVAPKEWKVPDANTPEYGDQKRLADSAGGWQIPTGVTPEYANVNDDRIGVPVLHHGRGDKLAVNGDGAFAKDQRQLAYYSDDDTAGGDTDKSEPIEIVGKIVARLADELESPATTNIAAIEKDDTRLSKDRVAVPVDKYAWKVPDAADPTYSVGNKLAEASKGPVKLAAGPLSKQDILKVTKLDAGDKPADADAKQSHAEKADVDEAANAADEVVGSVADLTKNVTGDGAPIHTADKVAALPAPAEKIEGGFEKSGSQLRLSDDAPETTDGDAPAERRVAVWSVPDGATPDYGVVDKLERGLNSVKAAAVTAGDEIAEKVTALNSKVKDAVGSAEKWEVPTGVTWGESEAPAEEVQVAGIPADNVVEEADEAVDAEQNAETEKEVEAGKDAEAERADDSKLANVESDAIEGDGKMREVAIDGSATDTGEPKMFVSSQMAPVGEAPVTANAKDDEPVKVASRDEGDGLSVVKSLKRVFSLLTEDEAKDDLVMRPAAMSRVDKVRFDALKTLMVDRVDYEVTDAKKGLGHLTVTGRSQPEVRLSLYVDMQYLGDVDADEQGEWSLEKDLYLTRGQHLLRAEQMTDGGLMLARKAQPFAQAVAMNQPEGYEKPSVGIGLGDKALAVMRDKLKSDNSQTMAFNNKSGLPNNALMSPALAGLGDAGMADEAALAAAKQKKSARVVSNTPLPVLKPAELRLAESKGQHRLNDKAGVQHVAMVQDADVARDSKGEKQAVIQTVEEKPVAKEAAAKLADAPKDTKQKAASADDADARRGLAETRVAALTETDDDAARLAEKAVVKEKDEAAAAGKPDAVPPVNKRADAKEPGLEKPAVKTAGDVDKTADDLAVAKKADDVSKAKPAKVEVAALEAGNAISEKKAAEEKAAEKKPAEKKLGADDKEAADEPSKKAAAIEETKIADAGTVDGIYTVKRGDTLAGIAKKVYGDARRYKEILKLNPKLKSANLIYPKQKLTVRGDASVAADETPAEPVKVAAVKDVELPAKKVVDEPASGEKTAEAKEEKVRGDKEFYVVKSGDSLWKIAQQVYGNGGRFKEIIELNPDLKKNPGLIRPKVKLRVKAA